MGGIFVLFPLVEKSEFLIEISFSSGIFSSLPLVVNQILSYVTPPQIFAQPRPHPSDNTGSSGLSLLNGFTYNMVQGELALC